MLSSASAALAAPARPLPIGGQHRSACETLVLHGRRTYTRLVIRFVGARYASSETLYSDPKCEISVLETASQGTWGIARGNVLRLHLARMQIRPLDPRIVDRLTAGRACGKATWEYGAANEILGTACGKGRLAEYFVGLSPSGKSLDLYECEGRRTIGKGCTHYEMARQNDPKSAKPRGSRPLARK
jgi:hypothetical protein